MWRLLYTVLTFVEHKVLWGYGFGDSWKDQLSNRILRLRLRLQVKRIKGEIPFNDL